MNYDVSVVDVIKQIYPQSRSALWKSVRENKQVDLNNQVILLDVRTPEEYLEAHLPNSVNIDHEDILKNVGEIAGRFQGKKIYAICRSGGRSDLVVLALRQEKAEAYNIKGGMIEWSRLNYPRVRPGLVGYR